MTCSTCGGPTFYEPEDIDRAYGQAFHRCRRFPACRGGAHTGPSDASIMRRENAVSGSRRARTLDEQYPKEPWF